MDESIRQQAEAWEAVCKKMDVVLPSWATAPGTGMDSMLASITKLGRQSAVAMHIAERRVEVEFGDRIWSARRLQPTRGPWRMDTDLIEAVESAITAEHTKPAAAGSAVGGPDDGR